MAEMTRFLLIRHGAHLLGGGKIAGRTGVQLSPLGHEQAAGLVDRLAHLPIRAIYCSPIERVRQTAQPLSEKLAVPVVVRDDLSEIDFGQWTGKALDELRPIEPWKQYNAFRSGAPIPGGEYMLQTQSRIVAEMLRLRQVHRNDCIALFSHGDLIKAAIAYFLGVPLDLFGRLEISLASVSVIALADYGPWVLSVNNTGSVELDE